MEEERREELELREKSGKKRAKEDALEQSRVERELMLICGMSGGGNKWGPIVAANKVPGDKPKKDQKKEKK